MTAPEIIRARLAEIGMTQTALVEKIGTTKQNFSNKMSRDSFSAAELAAIAAAIGLKAITRADCMLLPKGEKIAKLLHL